MSPEIKTPEINFLILHNFKTLLVNFFSYVYKLIKNNFKLLKVTSKNFKTIFHQIWDIRNIKTRSKKPNFKQRMLTQ